MVVSPILEITLEKFKLIYACIVLLNKKNPRNVIYTRLCSFFVVYFKFARSHLQLHKDSRCDKTVNKDK